MKSDFFCGYTIGDDAFKKIYEVCSPLGKNVLIIGGETALSKSLQYLLPDMEKFNIIDTVIYGKECYEERANEIFTKYKDKNIDFVMGVGGGKALDTAKFTADLLGKTVVTVPTIASTCAASSALSVVYTENHIFSKFRYYEKPAYHCFINTKIIADAPDRYLRAGIGDTAAKYYEVNFSARGMEKSYRDNMALSISEMCNKPLFEDSKKAITDCKNGVVSRELENVIRIILISTGMVSMLINSKFNGAVAHALFYGLTEIEGFEENFLHGDVVGYAIIVQLLVDGNCKEAKKVKKFLQEIGIETTLKERNLEIRKENFEKVLESAISDPDMEVIPYEITKDMLFEAILQAEKL